jgi:hypothetical protein
MVPLKHLNNLLSANLFFLGMVKDFGIAGVTLLLDSADVLVPGFPDNPAKGKPVVLNSAGTS